MTVHERWAKVLAGLSHIPKQRSNGVNYEFRGIDALMQHLHPLLATNELTLSPRVLDDWRLERFNDSKDRAVVAAYFRVEVDVVASDGTVLTLGPGLAMSHDYGDKAAYQAQQNAIKYVLLESLCVPVDEPDMDGRNPEPVPAPADPGKLAHIRKLYEQLPAGATSKPVEELVAFAEVSDANADVTIAKLETALEATP